MGVFNMNRKITALVIFLIFSLCLAGIAFAENESSDSLKTADDGEDIEVEDTSNYITITGISNGKITFSDGFAGYAIDSSKGKITSDDTFTLGEFKNSKINFIRGQKDTLLKFCYTFGTFIICTIISYYSDS